MQALLGDGDVQRHFPEMGLVGVLLSPMAGLQREPQGSGCEAVPRGLQGRQRPPHPGALQVSLWVVPEEGGSPSQQAQNAAGESIHTCCEVYPGARRFQMLANGKHKPHKMTRVSHYCVVCVSTGCVPCAAGSAFQGCPGSRGSRGEQPEPLGHAETQQPWGLLMGNMCL